LRGRAIADTDIPNFKNYAEGEPIPPVDAEDIKRMWEYERTHTKVNAIGWQWLQGLKAVLSPEAEFSDVSSRHRMITTLIICKLLTPWQNSEDLHEAVFRIAATFPLHEVKHKSYMIAGDEHFGFDPNAFVQKLIEETDISQVWEPVRIKVPEGGRCCSFVSADFSGQVLNPEREAKRNARQLAWAIWKRFAPSLDEVLSHMDKEHASEPTFWFWISDCFVCLGDCLGPATGTGKGNAGREIGGRLRCRADLDGCDCFHGLRATLHLCLPPRCQQRRGMVPSDLAKTRRAVPFHPGVQSLLGFQVAKRNRAVCKLENAAE
jgi:hypothetical protein